MDADIEDELEKFAVERIREKTNGMDLKEERSKKKLEMVYGAQITEEVTLYVFTGDDRTHGPVVFIRRKANGLEQTWKLKDKEAYEFINNHWRELVTAIDSIANTINVDHARLQQCHDTLRRKMRNEYDEQIRNPT